MYPKTEKSHGSEHLPDVPENPEAAARADCEHEKLLEHTGIADFNKQLKPRLRTSTATAGLSQRSSRHRKAIARQGWKENRVRRIRNGLASRVTLLIFIWTKEYA